MDRNLRGWGEEKSTWYFESGCVSERSLGGEGVWRNLISSAGAKELVWSRHH